MGCVGRPGTRGRHVPVKSILTAPMPYIHCSPRTPPRSSTRAGDLQHGGGYDGRRSTRCWPAIPGVQAVDAYSLLGISATPNERILRPQLKRLKNEPRLLCA